MRGNKTPSNQEKNGQKYKLAIPRRENLTYIKDAQT